MRGPECDVQISFRGKRLDRSPVDVDRSDFGIPIGLGTRESAYGSDLGGAACFAAIPLICVSVRLR